MFLKLFRRLGTASKTIEYPSGLQTSFSICRTFYAVPLSRTIHVIPPCRSFHAVPLAHSLYGQALSVSDQPTPLIILHGLFGSKQNWNSVAKSLNRRLGRTVITLDSRNHGDSPHAASMSYADMADDVVAFMEDVGLEKGLFLGHSMGGKTVMFLSLTRPDMVESLIVEDISPRISSSIGLIPNFIEAMKRVKLSSDALSLSQARKEVDEQLLWTAKDAGVRAFLLTNLAMISDKPGWEIKTKSGASSKFCWRVNLAAISSDFMDIMLFPEEFVRPYRGRTLFVGGSNSAYISHDDLPSIEKLFPHSKVLHIKDAGHWVHAEKPNEFINEVVSFLNLDEQDN